MTFHQPDSADLVPATSGHNPERPLVPLLHLAQPHPERPAWEEGRGKGVLLGMGLRPHLELTAENPAQC